MAEKSNQVKKRHWTFLVWPDSAPADWIDVLTQTGLPAEISPLHDSDVNPEGSPKKPHHHVTVCYQGPTTFNVVKGLTDRLNTTIPQPLESVKGMHRYFTHADNPEKAQYDPSKIQYLNGFSILDYSDLTRSELVALRSRVQEYIIDADLYEYADLLESLLANGMTDLLDCAQSNTILFNSYLSSRRHRRTEGGHS